MHLGVRSQLSFLAALISLACDKPGRTPVAGGGVGSEGMQPPTTPAAGTARSAGAAGDAGAPTAGCGAALVEEGFVDVEASDAGIRYVGRLDFANVDAPKMAFPAVTIEALFEGDAIDMRLQETAPGGSARTAYYDVSIDSEPPIKLMTCTQQEVYPLARNLAEGTHLVRISKRTEAQVGTASFLGFRVRPGTTLSLPDAAPRRVEFVGDSITCGYGNEVSTTDPDSYTFTSANENALLAYGAVTARALGADYVAVAASGRGMVRNYSGSSGLTAPQFYDLTSPDASGAAWDTARYAPDVIVINLGTNDFSPGLAADELETMRSDFRQTYQEFLTHLRATHPLATLIAAVGPMMNDSYPEGYQAWTSIRSDVQEAVNARIAEGDSDLFYLEFSPQRSPYGEDWHPTMATHQEMADVLTEFIQQKKGW